METAINLAAQIEERLLLRNEILERFFSQESRKLAEACREMAERFLLGGRLLAFGRGAYSTDAQHVSVEFVHPVIVGKRALPALDLSAMFRPWMDAILRPEDIVMGFGPPEGDLEVWAVLEEAQKRGAMTFALPGPRGTYALQTAVEDPFIHQELVEIFYHTLWETVHVFLEHRELGQDVGSGRIPLSIPRPEKAGDFQHRRRRRRLNPDESARRHRIAQAARYRRGANRLPQPLVLSTSASHAAENSSSSATEALPPTPMTGPSTAFFPPSVAAKFLQFRLPWSRQTSPRSPTMSALK